VSMRQLNPYQVNFLMAIGMAVTAVPALWIKQGSLTVPTKTLPLGAPIGLLMALGSICFVLALSEVPVGTATAISTSYVLLVLFLSWFFLKWRRPRCLEHRQGFAGNRKGHHLLFQ